MSLIDGADVGVSCLLPPNSISQTGNSSSSLLTPMRTLQRLHHFKRRLPIQTCFHRKLCSQPSTLADSCGIPLEPSWSVNELLSSYPSPTLPNETIQKLYQLSALIPPEQDTPQYKTVKKDLEEIIRLVEAVRLVDTTEVSVRKRREREDADRENLELESEAGGQALLKHAYRTQNGFYVVDSERKQ